MSGSRAKARRRAKAVGPFPAAAFGRLDRDHGFGLLLRSPDAADELIAEMKELAIGWWGSRPSDVDWGSEAIGHFPAASVAGWFYLYKALPTSYADQPLRLFVAVPEETYREYGYSPFVFERAGFFDFARGCLQNLRMGRACPRATGRPATAEPREASTESPLPGPDESLIAGVLRRLESSADRSWIVSSASTKRSITNVIQNVVDAMPVEELRQYTVSTFSFTRPGLVKQRAPVIACIYAHDADNGSWREGLDLSTDQEKTRMATIERALQQLQRDVRRNKANRAGAVNTWSRIDSKLEALDRQQRETSRRIAALELARQREDRFELLEVETEGFLATQWRRLRRAASTRRRPFE